MNWDSTHAERAAKEGWHLLDTIDNGSKRPYYMVGSVRSAFPSDAAAMQYVIDRAKGFSNFHQYALKVVASSRVAAKERK